MCPSLCPRPSGLAKLFPPPRRTALAAGCCAPLLGIRFTPKLALSLRLSSDPTKYRKFVPRRSGLGDFFLRFVYHLSKYWVLKCLQGGRVLCGPHPDPSPRPSPFVFEGRRGVAAAAPAGWPWKAPGHEPAQHEHSSAPARRLEHTSPKGPEIWFSRARQAGNGAARPRATI